MGHFPSGSAETLPRMAEELAPGWDACSLAGCIGEEVVRENYAGSGAVDKPQCIQVAVPAEHCNYT